MTKQQTVEAFRDEFLKGKSQQYIDKFLAKDMLKQYGSIMSWRRKNRKQQLRESTAKDVIAYLEASRDMINALPDISEEEIGQVRAELNSLVLFLDEKKEERRQAEIETLERQKAEISHRLAHLRGEEPSLF